MAEGRYCMLCSVKLFSASLTVQCHFVIAFCQTGCGCFVFLYIFSAVIMSEGFQLFVCGIATAFSFTCFIFFPTDLGTCGSFCFMCLKIMIVGIYGYVNSCGRLLFCPVFLKGCRICCFSLFCTCGILCLL